MKWKSACIKLRTSKLNTGWIQFAQKGKRKGGSDRKFLVTNKTSLPHQFIPLAHIIIDYILLIHI